MTTLHNATHPHHAAPRIYVACLAAYTNGKLHGQWIDCDQSADEILAVIADLLAASPEPRAEEFAIHDYEGFANYSVDEYEPIANVAPLAELVMEHGDAITSFLNHTGYSIDEASEKFTDAYRGVWTSVEQYAEEWLSETGSLEGIAESLRGYFDYDSFARDLELGGDIWTHLDANGMVHIFDSHI